MSRFVGIFAAIALTACGAGTSSSVTVGEPATTAIPQEEDASVTVASHREDGQQRRRQRDFSADPRLAGKRTTCAVQVGDGVFGSTHTTVGAGMAEPVLVQCLASR